MATGRKGPSAPSRKRPPTPPDAAPPRAVDDGGDDDDDLDAGDFGFGPAPGPTGLPADDLVTVVRGLAAAIAEHGLTELIVDTPEVTFTLRRGGHGQVTQAQQLTAGPSMQTMQIPTIPMSMPSMPMVAPVGPASSGALTPTPTAPPAVEDKTHLVTSPFVGTFYRRPNPDAAEYVKVNDKVQKGTVLCIVEAMKLMNEIEADIAGTVVGVLAEDGAPVEYGQPLFKIAPA